MSKPVIQFNGAKADYTSPAYLARAAQREARCKEMAAFARICIERMTMKTHRPK